MADQRDEYRVDITADERDGVQGVNKFTRAEREMEQQTKETGRASDQASKQTKQFTDESERSKGVFDRVRDALGQWKTQLLGLFGAGAIMQVGNKVLQEQNFLLEEQNRLLRERAQIQQQSFVTSLDPRFLGASDEDIAQARQQAAEAGLLTEGTGQADRALAEIISRRSQSTPERRQAIFREAVDLARGTPGGLDTVLNPFLTIENFVGDPRRASNILAATIEAAGEPDPQKLAPLIGQVIGTGVTTGGLTPGEASAFIAGTTGQGVTRERAATGTRILIERLLGARTPTGQEVLPEIGITRDLNAVEAFRRFAEVLQSGELGEQQITEIIGQEAKPIATTILSDQQKFGAFIGRIEAVRQAEQRDPSRTLIAEQKFQEQLRDSESFRQGQRRRVAESLTTLARVSDPQAQNVGTGRAIIERRLEEAVTAGEISAARKTAALELFDTATSAGFGPAAAAEAVERFTDLGVSDLNQGVPIDLSRLLLRRQPDTALRGSGGEAGLLNAFRIAGSGNILSGALFPGPISSVNEVSDVLDTVQTEARELNITNINQQFNDTRDAARAEQGRGADR